MTRVKHVVLDVLKPHRPNILELAQAIAALGSDYQIDIEVMAVDERTESVSVEVDADDIDYEAIVNVITKLGGSLHSIDRVEVHGAS